MTRDNPLKQRASGILLHPTSLPGPYGVGDLGPEAHRFLEFLARAGQSWWQMLPLTPPGGGDSPYDSPSSFAASPLLASVDHLVRDGLLTPDEVVVPRRLAEAERALYPTAWRFRERWLRRAFERFKTKGAGDEKQALERFRSEQSDWVNDWALFSALKRANPGKRWPEWDEGLRRHDAAAVERAREQHADEIDYHVFVQYRVARDLAELRRHAGELGVRLMGDVPMFVAHDGADVWQNQRFFQLDERGERRVVAGVPPDYFSADGQLWGNPLYDWEALKADNFSWWVRRLGQTLERFDAVRLDHFIGFHRYWEVSSSATTARDGRFVLVPGREFFEKARETFGTLPFIAEDLGLLTPEVVELRERFDLPGMRVLMFAFVDQSRDYQPHRFPKSSVVYTGTHDNDTTVGWLTAHERVTDPGHAHWLREERDRALRYAGSDGREPHWDMIRLAMASVADTALFPLQDVLGLGTEHRMNVPGVAKGNWRWRFRRDALTPAVAERLFRLTETYERVPHFLRRPG
jgi:4-alpha-glucanotransferase